MRKYFSLALVSLFSLSLIAQTSGEDPSCREKCSHASLYGTEQINYFQYPSMNKYNLHYLKLDLNAEMLSRNIDGTALMNANVVQVMDSFIIELRGMTLDSVYINGTKRSFTRANDHVFIPLSPSLPAGSQVSAVFYYRGAAGTGGVFVGTQASSGLNYTATLSESYQAREWFPSKQFLQDKIDSTDVWITTTPPGIVGSNGLLTAVVDVPGGKKQYRWKTRYPMAYYLVSFAIGNYMNYENFAKPAAISPDSILIQHFIVNNPTYFTNNKAQLDKTPTFIEQMSIDYGLYPFYQEKYGHAHSGIGGGMEHQTMSTMNSFGTTLISHELAHQWWGDNVTCATWNHIWLNEGFASYSEYLMTERLPALHTTTASAYMQAVHVNVMSSPGGSVFVPDISVYDENRIFNSRLSYNKGSAIIHTMRFESQNDILFFQGLRNFQTTFKNTVATANDLKLVMESTTGKNLTDFFNQWYYGEGFPTFNVDYSKQGDSIVLFVNQTVSMPAVTPFFKGLYEFRINTTQGDTTVKVNMTANNQTFKFRSNRTPTGIVVDPNNWVLNQVGSITTGLNDPVNVSDEVILSPNPSTGTFRLKYGVNSFSSLQVFDATGKLMIDRKIDSGSSRTDINSGLLPGTYVIRLNGTKKIATKKLVIVD
jgi:aminopeptidase N